MKNQAKPTLRALSGAALATALCGMPAVALSATPAAAQKATQASNTKDGINKSKLASELAAALQACSFDGSPLQIAPPDLSQGGDTGAQVVGEIMKHTGLPANFVVIEGQVPNAAAMIVLDNNKVPRRVIAYNRSFMADVIQATKRNNWAPVSIMAHEIGHHLSGHTIVPGGSQPPIELESDKFSGFVLYKMGAPLADAQRAIATLVPEADGATHPGRSKRLAAVQDGWRQACQLQGGGNCTGQANAPAGAGTTASPAPAQVQAANSNSPQARSRQGTSQVAQAAQAAGPAQRADALPAANRAALPSKGTQFIYDEFGYLDAATRAQEEKALFEHAQKTGVEVVLMLVKSLNGMSAQDYAWAMMRQLRVGKLDVGNGAVLVVAPEQKAAAVAYGPGIALERDASFDAQMLADWVADAWPTCKQARQCAGWSLNLTQAASKVRMATTDWDWTVRYTSLGALQSQTAAELGKTTPQNSTTWRKFVRLSGVIESMDPRAEAKGQFVSTVKLEKGMKPMLVRTDDGLNAMVYVQPQTEQLMPGARLQKGMRYTMVARESGVNHNPNMAQGLDLVSYNVTE